MNLVVLYPHYLFFGDGYDFPTGATGYGSVNVVNASMQLTYKKATAGSSSDWSADLNLVAADDRSPDYIYCAGLNLSIAKGGQMNVILQGSTASDFSASTQTTTVNNVNLSNLVGRNSDDYVLEAVTNDARRYWRGRIVCGTAVSNFQHELRKMYFGQWWYPGVEPDAPFRMSDLPGDRMNRRRLNLRWRGVTNDKLYILTERIIKHRRYNPVVLYTREWHSILNGERTFRCEVTNFSFSRSVHNLNDVEVEFTEII